MYHAGVPKETVEYMVPLYPAPLDITRAKGPGTEFGPNSPLSSAIGRMN